MVKSKYIQIAGHVKREFPFANCEIYRVRAFIRDMVSPPLTSTIAGILIL